MFNGDNGMVNIWSFVVIGIGEVGLILFNFVFIYDVLGLLVSFINNSNDVNDDIVSYSWDFGDGFILMEENLMYVYVSIGVYDVIFMVIDFEG